jgi:hypothetical protein
MLPENIAWAVTKFFYWNSDVQNYQMDIVYYHPASKGQKDDRRWAKYNKEHGNSLWATVDFYLGKVRIIVFLVGVVTILALIVGWRP